MQEGTNYSPISPIKLPLNWFVRRLGRRESTPNFCLHITPPRATITEIQEIQEQFRNPGLFTPREPLVLCRISQLITFTW